ncbi:MAG: excinuclease ABC subunit UvrA, partial [Armatimonadetes bacterium]|nr:excinuclease ABC subunit UvrA [Armatimonadota bacterium]
MPETATIRIKGARQHNLRNLDITIPRNRLVVITGLSGSGKSSLAFDTLYAEGQRKYVESLSSYARQFLDQMQKPDVDYIEGLSPAIAIEQRTAASNPRSTISTTTEIYDYLRLLYSAAGKPHDPHTGEPVVRQTPQQIADAIRAWGEGTRVVLLAPLVENETGEFRDVIEKAKREGFVRIRIDGEILELNTPEPIKLAKTRSHVIEAVVDRIVIRDGIEQRLSDSIELALRWGENRIVVLHGTQDAEVMESTRFSTDFCNPRTGYTLPRLTPKHFSFNSHLGACPACQGIGTENFLDPELMVDPAKTLEDGAVRPWKQGT